MASVDLNTVLTTLTIAAGLALGIERTLELLKHFMDLANGSLGKAERKDVIGRAEQAIADAKEALSEGFAHKPVVSVFAGMPSAQSAEKEKPKLNASDFEASEKYPPPPIPVIPPTPISPLTTGYQLFFLMAASGLGMISAQVFQIRLLAVLTAAADMPTEHSLPFIFLDIIFTGLVIGGGSQPIHELIRFITERKVDLGKEEAAVVKENAKFKALDTVVSTSSLVEEKKEQSPFQWKDIVYHGGVNPESLKNTHLRPGPPNLVVFHHTAMSSAASFQDVVDEFLVNKKWLTGYNCVIMPDGEIKPFCPWSRAGNHAMGHNARSLGLSFHGNFHTDPSDHYSNADGRFGNQQPTEAQLHAGARVVALWIYLYPDIKLDFEHNILAHKEVMPGHTVCPGSNFKYDEFKQLIRQYYDAWATSPVAQQQISAFKKLDYVYA